MIPSTFLRGVMDGDFPAMEQALAAAAALGTEDRARMVNYVYVQHDHQTPLHMAATEGFGRIVKALLEALADPNVQDSNGQTPLHHVCTLGKLEVAKILLVYNATVDIKDEQGATPLHIAAVLGHLSVCALLLDNGAGASTKTNGRTPLHFAAMGGHPEVAQILLKYNAAVDIKDEQGSTPLLIACVQGHSEVAQVLLEYHANVESMGTGNARPLHCAAYSGDPTVCGVVLAYGARLEAKTQQGETALDVAVRTNHAAVVVGYLLQRYAENVTAHEGSRAIHAILRAATYSYVPSQNFHPPLALEQLLVQLPLGKLTMDHFRTLLQSFAPHNLIRSRDVNGRLPLHVAASLDTPNEIFRLLAHEDPAALHTRDSTGAMPLHAACQAALPSSKYTIPLLVELYSAAAHSPNHDGFLPFHLLCRANDPPVDAVKYLLRHSPGFVSVTTPDGALPVMLACEATTSSSSLDVLQELLTAHPGALVYMRRYYSSSD